MPLKPGDYLAASWAFNLFEFLDGATRLVVRFRADWASSAQNALFYRAFVEPGAFLMGRKMLLGIKQRAENQASPACSPKPVPNAPRHKRIDNQNTPLKGCFSDFYGYGKPVIYIWETNKSNPASASIRPVFISTSARQIRP